MKVNYVLMYGVPYLRYKEFETFEDCSKWLINHTVMNYTIFKKLNDKEELEMIYRDNDIRYLEEFSKNLNNKIDKAIEYINHAQTFGKSIRIPYVNGMDLLEILKGDSNE